MKNLLKAIMLVAVAEECDRLSSEGYQLRQLVNMDLTSYMLYIRHKRGR